MKPWITLLAAAAVFASCSKEKSEEQSSQARQSTVAAFRQAQEGVYVSDWEQYNDWTKTDEGNLSRFAIVRKSPEIDASVLNGGIVLGYSRIALADPAYAPFNYPKMMPFYFLPEAERPNPQQYYFSDQSTNGNITVVYQGPYTKEEMPVMGGGASLRGMRFQFVAMTKAFLDSHGLTANTIRNYYTYDQVMTLVNP